MLLNSILRFGLGSEFFSGYFFATDFDCEEVDELLLLREDDDDELDSDDLRLRRLFESKNLIKSIWTPI